MVFAGLTQRLIAAFIDAVLLLIAIIAILACFPTGMPGRTGELAVMIAAAIVSLGVVPATKLGATLGKRITGIRVTTTNGEPLGIMRSLARFAFLLLTIGTAGIGFLVAAWTPKRQSLHDFGAQTVVVHRKATQAEIADAVTPPIWWFNRVLGILLYAALAGAFWMVLDTRKTSETRARLGVAVDSAMPYRQEVNDALLDRKPIPPPPKTPGPDTRALYARPDGSVVLEVADALLPGGRVVYTPSIASGRISWKCAAENIKRNYLPPPCRH